MKVSLRTTGREENKQTEGLSYLYAIDGLLWSREWSGWRMVHKIMGGKHSRAHHENPAIWNVHCKGKNRLQWKKTEALSNLLIIYCVLAVPHRYSWSQKFIYTEFKKRTKNFFLSLSDTGTDYTFSSFSSELASQSKVYVHLLSTC